MLNKKQREEVMKFKDILKIEVEKEQTTVLTSDIYMDNVLLGRYKIILNLYIEENNNNHIIQLDNFIKIYNVSKMVEIETEFKNRIDRGPSGSLFHHPHIWNNHCTGEPHTCFGNIKFGIISLLKDKEYVVLISILLEFLKNSFGWIGITQKEMLEFWEDKEKKVSQL